MLSKGENKVGIDAYYLGERDIGEWVVNGILLSRVIYAILIPANDVKTWKRYARELDELLKNR